MGDAEGSLAWLGIHTSTDGIKGEMLMNWVHNDLIGDDSEMAPGHGVWELIDTGTYSFTWYSLIKSDDPSYPPVPIRVYGTAQMMTDCDNVTINYTFEMQVESGWIKFDTGIAYETRLKVYTPADPQ